MFADAEGCHGCFLVGRVAMRPAMSGNDGMSRWTVVARQTIASLPLHRWPAEASEPVATPGATSIELKAADNRWLDGQASHAREQLDTLPRREELLTRIRELGGALPQYSDFTPAGDRIFYLAREPGASRCRILAHITAEISR
ncbi:hypothetical protein [Nonomuraea sp. NPDC049709]|uniref:hypothetical protein n=1 Tax=Nonomuraea sp. NPDC049709 TaxID=3154736 RepID=UPI00342D63C7